MKKLLLVFLCAASVSLCTTVRLATKAERNQYPDAATTAGILITEENDQTLKNHIYLFAMDLQSGALNGIKEIAVFSQGMLPEIEVLVSRYEKNNGKSKTAAHKPSER